MLVEEEPTLWLQTQLSMNIAFKSGIPAADPGDEDEAVLGIGESARSAGDPVQLAEGSGRGVEYPGIARGEGAVMHRGDHHRSGVRQHRRRLLRSVEARGLGGSQRR